MSEIQIISKESHKTLSTTMESTTTLPTEPSVVLLKVPMNDISVIKKDGLNAIVFLKNGEKIVIQNFFNEENTLDNSLVIQADNGQLIWAKFKEAESDADADADADADTEAAAYVEEMPAAVPEVVEAPVSDVIFQPIDAVEPLLYHDAGLSPWLWAVPLVAGGIIAAASDNGGKGGGKKDNTPPNSPEDVVIGNGDGFITPDEIANGTVDVVVVLPETGVSVGDKVIVNGEEHTITAGDLTAGQITVPVTVPPEGQPLEVQVSIKDPAGNTSSTVTETASVDTTAPATPVAPSSYADNVGAIQNPTSTAVTTDDNTPGINVGVGLTDTPTLYVDGVAVDAVYDPVTGTLTPNTPLLDGVYDFSYTLTDAAGNESAQSPTLTIEIDGALLDAIDDLNTSQITVTDPDTTLIGDTGNTFTLLGFSAVFDLINVALSNQNALNFDVDSYATEDVTINVSGNKGLDISAVITSVVGLITQSTYTADLTLINTTTGEFFTVSNGITLTPTLDLDIFDGTPIPSLTLAYSGSVDFTGLPEGHYDAAVTGETGSFLAELIGLVGNVGLGSNVTMTITDATEYGTTEIVGNVVTNGSSTDVQDIYSGTVTVTTVVSETGNNITAGATETPIVGAYGTLYIREDGGYRYVADTSDLTNIGKVDTFTYTLRDSTGATDIANLNIRVESPIIDVTWNSDPTLDGTANINATNDTAIAPVSVEPVIDTSYAYTGTVTASATRTGVSVIPPSTGTASFAEGITSSTGLILTSNTDALLNIQMTRNLLNTDSAGESYYYVIKQNGSTVFTSSPVIAGALNSIIIDENYHIAAASSAGTWTVEFHSSETNAPILNGINETTVSVGVTAMVIDQDNYIVESPYAAPFPSISSNLLTNDTGAGSTTGTKVLVTVDGVNYVEASGQSITGTYGTFVVNADGSYIYTANGSAILGTDVLNYKLLAVTGDESAATLSVNLAPEQNNIAISSTTSDTFSLGAGSDTLIFGVLNSASATGGNTTVGGIDTWTDFHLGDVATDSQADKIDISSLLNGSPTALTIGQYVDVNYNAATQTVTLSVDRDGGLLDLPSNFTETPILQLTNITSEITLQDLLNNGQIIY
ncbi:BapA/Bap/LapF family large adhesin [Acinetobacter sp. P1(2025)]|uniref:BapA/Bap/LapF family large adhesin n=1 Tax=Acinetobacter sp. P1(2025) TaxID=3446120 RepID=UPI003F529135